MLTKRVDARVRLLGSQETHACRSRANFCHLLLWPPDTFPVCLKSCVPLCSLRTPCLCAPTHPPLHACTHTQAPSHTRMHTHTHPRARVHIHTPLRARACMRARAHPLPPTPHTHSHTHTCTHACPCRWCCQAMSPTLVAIATSPRSLTSFSLRAPATTTTAPMT